MAKQKATVYTATKAVSLWDVDNPTGWTLVGGEKKASEHELVPIVSFCIDELAKTAADVPFSLYDKKGKLVDDSDTWDNLIGFMPNPQDFIRACISSLVMSGAVYFGRKNNAAGYTKEVKYYAIGSTRPDIKPETTKDNLAFIRDNKTLPAKEVFYCWLPDANVEFGPATNYPLVRAMKAAGALSSISSFIDNYMTSGMVKAFVAQSETPARDEDERAEIEDYLTRILTGVKRTLSRIRVLRKGITVQSIGGGLDELRNVTIVDSIKQDVLQAFGVPESRARSSAANYATAQMDTFNFVVSGVIPLCLVLQQAINEQLLAPWGYTWKFEPTRMDSYGYILAEKMKPLKEVAEVFSMALTKANSLKAALDIIGVEVNDEIMAMIDEAIAEERRDPVPMPEIPPQQPAAPVEMEEQEEPEIEINTKALVELDKWQTKSERAGKLVTWHPVDLTADIMDAVKSGVSWADARAMLMGSEIEAESDIIALARAIERAADVEAQKAVTLTPAPQPITVNLTANMPQPGEPTISVPVTVEPPVNNITVQPAESVVNVSPTPVNIENNVTAQAGELNATLTLPKPPATEIVVGKDGKYKELRPK